MSFTSCLIVMLGGALGTLARYIMSILAEPISRQLPLNTMIINIAGSFIIGFFGTLTLSHGKYPVPEGLRLLVMVGFCGGFTTFSSFSLQTFDLLRSEMIERAFFNIIASTALCLAAVALGHSLAAQLNGGAKQVSQYRIEEEA